MASEEDRKHASEGVGAGRAHAPDPKPSDHLKNLLKLWESKRAGRSFPSRDDFDPFILKPWLGSIELVDVTASEPPRYRFRLVGVRINDIDGHDVTGKYAHEVFKDNYDYIVRDYDEAVAMRRPIIRSRQWVKVSNGFQFRYDKLVLPLSDDDKVINMLIVFLDELPSSVD